MMLSSWHIIAQDDGRFASAIAVDSSSLSIIAKETWAGVILEVTCYTLSEMLCIRPFLKTVDCNHKATHPVISGMWYLPKTRLRRFAKRPSFSEPVDSVRLYSETILEESCPPKQPSQRHADPNLDMRVLSGFSLTDIVRQLFPQPPQHYGA